MSKIVFLDIEGPMIPLRAIPMAGQTKGPPSVFDPCAVGLLNRLCDKTGAKIVIHSHWRKSPIHIEKFPCIKTHCISQGVKENHFHEDHLCKQRVTSDRWHDIDDWLLDHKETAHYVIIEDTAIPLGFEYFEPRVIPVSYEDGFNWKCYEQALGLFGQKERIIY